MLARTVLRLFSVVGIPFMWKTLENWSFLVVLEPVRMTGGTSCAECKLLTNARWEKLENRRNRRRYDLLVLFPNAEKQWGTCKNQRAQPFWAQLVLKLSFFRIFWTLLSALFGTFNRKSYRVVEKLRGFFVNYLAFLSFRHFRFFYC